MSERAPGFEEYAPSRLEWFAVSTQFFYAIRKPAD